MKTFNEFILERLKLNKDTKSKGYDPNFLNGDKTILYDSSEAEDEDEQDMNWEDCQTNLDTIDGEYDAFLRCEHYPLANDPKKDYNIEDYSTNLKEIIDNIIGRGDAYGYEFILENGHLTITKGYNGGHSSDYVYAITSETYNMIDDYFGGYEDTENLNILFEEGNIVPIEI